MEKLIAIPLILYSIAIAMIMPMAAHAIDDPQSPEAVLKWFKKLPNAKEKLTKLHFYFHDIVTADNPTAVPVAQANSTSASPTRFGAVLVFDDPLTQGPELSSKMIGRAQGIYASVSQQELGLLMTLNFVFTNGKFNGSTLSVLGHNPILHKYRELPILGGSGVFRLASGVATAQTYSRNATARNAVVEYNVVVLHY